MTCTHCQGIDRFFGERTARRELRRYRKKGATGATAKLLDALKAEGVEGAALLDIGGGVGVIQHELLAAGAKEALGVDASSAYLETVRAEADRRGNAQLVRGLQGDFVDVSEEAGMAEVVTLDKVLCCYPEMEELVSRSAGAAHRLYGLVLPRETKLIRVGFRIFNIYLWLRRSAFRTYVHPTADVEKIISAEGLHKKFRGRAEFMWDVAVYARPSGLSASES